MKAAVRVTLNAPALHSETPLICRPHSVLILPFWPCNVASPPPPPLPAHANTRIHEQCMKWHAPMSTSEAARMYVVTEITSVILLMHFESYSCLCLIISVRTAS
jgi:hypothetical protein